ncbi:hypothetical protein [Arthrobacter sp. ERGS1:01]|uniref:hypothetical protein n=1 Tax=Arthrobacter sp. ERGS1:01 TaxID=1704044 RepID=UPI0012379AC0|nr:hypothetical protein [Arthrobacter sp. ERGS1:01]
MTATTGGEGPGTTFSVTGGVGSIQYTLEEIADAGARLARLGSELAPMVDRLRAEWSWLCDAGDGAATYPYAATDALRAALYAAMHAQAGTADLAAKASVAARNYARTEAGNSARAAQQARLGALENGFQVWAWGPLAPLKLGLDALGVRGAAGRHGWRDEAESLLNNGPAYLAGLAGPGAGIAYLLSHPGAPDPATAGAAPAVALRKFLDASGMTVPGQLELRRVPTAEWDTTAPWQPGRAVSAPLGGEPATVEATPAGVLAGSRDAYGYPPGSIGVDRLDRPDGTRAWIVHLPGTESWWPLDGGNPWDVEGDMEGMTAGSKTAFAQKEVLIQQLIKSALADAGEVSGEDVMITGHSGGGIHAAAAAADPAFLADVNVKMIVIAGAPDKNQHVAAGIDVLDLENGNDIVPAADFGPSPATGTWVTATSHRPGNGSEGLKAFGDAHDLDNYLADARALQTVDDPAIQGSRNAINAFLAPAAGGVVAVSRFVYQGRDVNNPQSGRTGNKPGTEVRSGNNARQEGR